ncbi:hypothetical protein [Opitutus sp. ER46]|nr:hypothetical protein [Opitutus sp. ER46]
MQNFRNSCVPAVFSRHPIMIPVVVVLVALVSLVATDATGEN